MDERLLLQVKDLLHLFQRGRGRGSGRQRHLLQSGQGQGAGHRGRVRLRQERDRLLHHADSGATRARSCAAPSLCDGEEHRRICPKGRCASSAGNRVSIIFQDPMTSLNPVFTVGNQLREAIRLHTDRNKQAGPGTPIEMLQLVGVNEPEKRHEAVSLRALRRYAPAGDDRHGPGLRAGAS